MNQELIAYLEKKQDEQFRIFREDLGLIAKGIIGLHDRLGAFRREVAQDIDDVRTLIRPIYSALDQRVRNLEVSKDIEGRDVIQLIRERVLKS
jgi:hypothetical protein